MRYLAFIILILSQSGLGAPDCLDVHRKLFESFRRMSHAQEKERVFPSFLTLAKDLNGPIGKKILSVFERGERGSFIGEKGVPISFASWHVPKEKGAIVFLPGMKESFLFHPELIHDFIQEGYSVYVMDPRGQGTSGRFGRSKQIVHATDFMDYVRDEIHFIDEVVKSKPHEKVYGVGYSMGGLITTLTAIEKSNHFDATAAIAPPYAVNSFPFPKSLARLVLDYQIKMKNADNYVLFNKDSNPLDPFSKFSRHNDRMQFNAAQLAKYPELVMGGPSNQWVRTTMDAGDKALKAAKDYPLPHLLIRMDKDRVVVPQKISQFAALSSKTSLYSLPNAGHSVFQSRDENRQSTVTEVLRYLIHPELLSRTVSQADLDRLIAISDDYSQRNEIALARYSLDEAALLIEVARKQGNTQQLNTQNFDTQNQEMWNKIEHSPIPEQALYLFLSSRRDSELRKLHPKSP